MEKMRKVWRLMGIGCVLFGSGCQKKEEAKVIPPIPLEVSVVKRGDMSEVLTFTGDVEGEAEVQVFSTIPARIRSMKVDEGDEVKKGQILLIVKHSRLAQAAVQAQAQLAMVQSQLAGSQVGLSGAKVQKKSSLREYERSSRLLKEGAIGKKNVEMAKVQYDGAVNRVQSAETQVKALRAQVSALRAGLAQARGAKYDAIVRAPISGVITEKTRQLGDMANPQLPLMKVVKMDSLKVRIQLTEQELGKVKKGKRAELTVLAYPNRTFKGIVSKISPTLSSETRTASAEIQIPNIFPLSQTKRCRSDLDCQDFARGSCGRSKVCVEHHPLKPNMIATVRVFVKHHKDVVTIPSQALINRSFDLQGDASKGMAVLVMDKSGRPQKRRIRVDLTSDSERCRVLDGLQEGEKIVISGQNFYKPGLKITIVNQASLSKMQDKTPSKHAFKVKQASSTNLTKK